MMARFAATGHIARAGTLAAITAGIVKCCGPQWFAPTLRLAVGRNDIALLGQPRDRTAC